MFSSETDIQSDTQQDSPTPRGLYTLADVPLFNLLLTEMQRYETEAALALSCSLLEVLSHPDVDPSSIAALTSIEVKAKAMGKAFSHIAKTIDVWVRSKPLPEYKEGNDRSAAKVSLDKARYGHDMTGETYAGADGNFFPFKNGVPVWQKKLDRLNRKLTDAEYEREFAWQYELLVDQKQLLLCWDVATSVVNGRESTGELFVYVEATPFTPEELYAYLTESIKDGTFYKTNTRGKLIEWLVNKGHVKRIAFIPPAYFKEHGATASIAQWMQPVTPDLARLAVGTIVRTTPMPLSTWY